MNTVQEPLTGPLPQKGYLQDALFAGDKVPPFPFFIENPAELDHADLPANSSRESHGDQELSRVNKGRPETSPEPLPERCQFADPIRIGVPSDEPERGTSPEPLPERCQFAFSDGRQCRMARSEIHPSLCRFHVEREEQLFGDPAPFGGVVGASLDLPELYSACRDLTTAAGVNRALGQVFRLLAQRRISRQEAATFGHLAQLLLRSIFAMRQENLTIALGSSGSAAKGYPQDALFAGNKAVPSPPSADDSRRAVCAPDAFAGALSVSSPSNHVERDRGPNAPRSSATTPAEKKSPVLGPPGRDLLSCRAESPLPQDRLQLTQNEELQNLGT
jgi:hypothetical protein